MSKVLARRDYLELLNKSNSKRRQLLIDDATVDELKALIEGLYNIIHGKIKISRKEFNNLKRYKNSIRRIVDKRRSLQYKKKVIKQQGGMLSVALPLLVSALAPTITSLLRK